VLLLAPLAGLTAALFSRELGSLVGSF